MGRIKVTLPDDLETEAREYSKKNCRTLQNFIVFCLTSELNRRKKRHPQGDISHQNDITPV